ncbi:MAG TPA: YwqI/YxiC family protein [Pseudogracilibacillus sp.]|nr:YwqI/YxiC family protein [Pseudogracilibacillus sp.]
MSNEIRVNSAAIQERIADLRSSIQALDTVFSKEIEGDNQLDMVDAMNEIKQDYENLLVQFEALFVSNIDSTVDAVNTIEETDQHIAQGITLAK